MTTSRPTDHGMTILAPEGMLGYGIPVRSMAEGMKRNPHAIAVDAGSTDPGPYYLGAGVPFTNRRAFKRDLAMILEAARERRIPVLVGSAGGGGGTPHLEWTLDVYREICRERGYHFRTAVIGAEVDKDWLKRQIARGRTSPLDLDSPLTTADVDESVRIVAQMGYEPFIRALDMDAEVIIAGRAYDPAPIGALPMRAGFDPGLVHSHGKDPRVRGRRCLSPPRVRQPARLRGGELVHRGAAQSRQGVHGGLGGRPHPLRESGSVSASPARRGASISRRPPSSRSNPRQVRVSGTRYVKAPAYTLKLEGVRRVGYRTLAIAGVRDPILISQIDAYLENIRQRVAETYPDGYRLIFHVYGRDGVMGRLEQVKEIRSHEIGLVIEVVADDPDTSAAVLALARSAGLHVTYPGRKAIAGNLAFPFSPSDIKAGEVYEFNIYHLVVVDDPLELFPIEIVET